MVLILLGMLAANFAFRVHSERSAFYAVSQRMRTRLAAEAGIEKVLLMLRTQRDNVPAWFNNPEELNRVIVWTPVDPRTMVGTAEEELDEGTVAYRFSIVADDPFDDLQHSRYGVTDESAKVNINTADKRQLTRLIAQVAPDDVIIEELVDALIDWRDTDSNPQPNGAEAEFYASLPTPYAPKNGPFETVEELLMVRGFDGRVLYGEDHDRNGLLSPNEDDTDESFPEDNGDGVLNRGLYPYISVVSRDLNTDRENRARVNLYGEEAVIREALAEYFTDTAKIDFILQARNSPPELPTDEPDADPDEDEQDQGDDEVDNGNDNGNGNGNGNANGNGNNADNGSGDGGDNGNNDDDDELEGFDDDPNVVDGERNKSIRGRMQSVGRGDRGRGGGRGNVSSRDDNGGNENGDGSGNGDGGGTGSNGNNNQPPNRTKMDSPAELLIAEADTPNPLTLDDLPILMEHATTLDPALPQTGLINILTAPPTVLRTLPLLTAEDVSAIVQTRDSLNEDQRITTAWLVTQGLLAPEVYAAVAPLITTRGLQFTIESIGFADHIGTRTRLEVVVELRGPVGQIIYYRDLTNLGTVFPIREQEAELGLGARDG